MRGFRSLFLACVFCVAAPAVAQPAGRWFVSAGPIKNHDTTWGARAVDNTGVGVDGGVALSPHLELRLLADVPPAATIVFAHDIYAGIPPIVDRQIVTTVRARNLTLGVLAGWHFPVAPRVDLATGVGWSSSRRADRVSSVALKDRVETPEPPIQSRHRWSDSPIFAAGARVRLTTHLSIAPEVRFSGTRPANARARWCVPASPRGGRFSGPNETSRWAAGDLGGRPTKPLADYPQAGFTGHFYRF